MTLKRDKKEIERDILNSIKDTPQKPTIIMHQTNTNYGKLSNILIELMNKKYLNMTNIPIDNDKIRIIVSITDSGKNYLETLNKVY